MLIVDILDINPGSFKIFLDIETIDLKLKLNLKYFVKSKCIYWFTVDT